MTVAAALPVSRIHVFLQPIEKPLVNGALTLEPLKRLYTKSLLSLENAGQEISADHPPPSSSTRRRELLLRMGTFFRAATEGRNLAITATAGRCTPCGRHLDAQRVLEWLETWAAHPANLATNQAKILLTNREVLHP